MKELKAKHIKGATLSWPDLWNELGCEKDNGGRWYAETGTAGAYVSDNGYRTPSRSWPFSHARPLLTQKFAKYLTEQDPALAIKLGVAEEV